MNVGIFLGNMKEGLGGGYTFQESVISALETVETRHNVFVFYYGSMNRAKGSTGKLTYVPLLDRYWLFRQIKRGRLYWEGRSSSLLQQAADRCRVDMMWFASLHFVPLETPYICTVWDLEHRVHPFFPEVSSAGSWKARERLFSTMIPRAAYVISGTEAGKRQIVDFYHPDEERVRVIPFPVSPFALLHKQISREVLGKYGIDKPYLFYPAQFWPHKNHVALLRALKLIRDRHSLDMDAVFCGTNKGNLQYVKETAAELGVGNSVRFLGFVTTEELYALYQGAFALVYPSMFGPDNLPPIEAFAIGCPVVAANVSGAVEQLGDAAVLVDPRSEEEIARSVMLLHEEPDLRGTLIRKGKERTKHWTPLNYVKEILAIYDDFELYRRCWGRKEGYVHL